MKIKNSELESYISTFRGLAQSTHIHNIKLQYEIYKFAKQLDEEYTKYIDFRKQIEAKYFVIENGFAKIDEEANKPVFQEGKKLEDYVKELTELFDIEVDIPFNAVLTLDDLEEAGNNNEIAPKDFSILEKFFPQE